MTITPFELNRRADFGTVKTVQNPDNGSMKKTFVKAFSLWYASKTRTLNQQYQIQGTALENTKVIIVRHNPKVEAIKAVQIGDVMYDLVSYSPDESNNYNTYDFVTLKRRA
ncbi:phage head closure protein [Weissella paramesenteroides]|mgnify:CR=1 FL=1|jgi:SPP1 family predicted phage head-tail adaptor|uniref:phage head closure protein n=2 Tax=Weissella TaxID=46255 RepID=UPI00112A1ECA|nr:phage head closure protein [Weissella paramesenteroides]MBU7556880.1 phage head closure protein [Weissella paramesenteroides]MDF8375156.1 phage head closure protein [Weissella paramesenteroides]QPI45950.1 phage head closure protein [Weissella paramesenteroides]TPF01587.1 phage head-tail joining protein [Weissella paramesenteroides]